MTLNSFNIFKIEDIFTMTRGERQTEASREKGNVPYYSASQDNNGVTDFISNPTFTSKNKIVVSTFCHAYWAEGTFSASDEMTLLGHDKLNKYNALYICKIIEQNAHMYGFNRKAFSHRLKKQKIILPIKKDSSLDWEYMERQGKKLLSSQLIKLRNYLENKIKTISIPREVEKLTNKNWFPFEIEEVSTILSGQDIYARERIEGNTPYITSGATNNGIGYFVSNDNSTKSKDIISVNRNGAVGYAFYHPYEALFGNDTRRLIPNYSSKYSSLFLSHMITMQKEKYGYGLKMGTARLKKQKIMLPVNANNNPDWEYMKDYMKYVEYKQLFKLIEYLN